MRSFIAHMWDIARVARPPLLLSLFVLAVTLSAQREGPL
jgi:hypothetical protein